MILFDLIREYGALCEARRREEALKVLGEIKVRLGMSKDDLETNTYSVPRCPTCGNDWRYCEHPVEG